MRQDLSNQLRDFLIQYCDPTRPLLLGLSGGPDSLCLLHLLLSHSLDLRVAHVDHGWRQESAYEANLLSEYCRKLGLPFYLKKLQPNSLKGNLEAASRYERLSFFKELSERYHCQAIMLAHHADDQAETVLKRLFEGGSISFLSGMRSISTIHGLTIWRPLLATSKQEILGWLEERGLRGFEDSTNQDTYYLRARFRQKIIPQLSELFGKEISSNLCRLGYESERLQDYLKRKTAPFFHVQRGVFGSWIDLSSHALDPFEIEHLIRTFCHLFNIPVSQPLVKTMLDLILNGSADKKVEMMHCTFAIDRKRLFFHSPQLFSFPSAQKVENGQRFGPWRLHLKSDLEELQQSSSWQDVWRGMCWVLLPQGDYEIAAPSPKMPYKGSITLNKWWTDHKVPAFMRASAPVILKEGQVVHEFLTGRLHPQIIYSKRFIHFTLLFEKNHQNP